MKLKRLTPLKSVGRLSTLAKERIHKSKYLSEIQMILYATNLCYYSTRILRNEISVKNRNQVLQDVSNEMLRMNKILHKDNYYTLENAITKKEHRENFKKFGITKKKIEHKTK